MLLGLIKFYYFIRLTQNLPGGNAVKVPQSTVLKLKIHESKLCTMLLLNTWYTGWPQTHRFACLAPIYFINLGLRQFILCRVFLFCFVLFGGGTSRRDWDSVQQPTLHDTAPSTCPQLSMVPRKDRKENRVCLPVGGWPGGLCPVCIGWRRRKLPTGEETTLI